MLFWNSPDVTADSGKPTGFSARAYPSYTAPGMYHTVKLSYSVDNLGEIGSTAARVYSFAILDLCQLCT